MIREFSLRAVVAGLLVLFVVSCAEDPATEQNIETLATGEPRPEIYADFTLTADLSLLTEDQRQMIALLIDASEIMDDLFWRQAYGDDYKEWRESV